MIFNLSGGCIAGSGSGAGLNFKIIGGTSAPENPIQNMVWINTDMEITSWSFSEVQPAEEVGKVWIKTGLPSQVEFNILKKNEIMIYPTKAYQYNGSSWEEKVAKSYKNDSWIDWIIYLYDAGNQYDNLTGGWIVRGNNSNNDTFGVGKVTFNEDSMTVSSSKNHSFAYLTTKNVIDLTTYDEISVVCTDNHAPDGTILGVYPTDCNWVGGYINGEKYISVSDGTNILDISDISGERYIAIRSACSGDGESFSVTITEVSMK